jgi:serine protease AprX
MSNKYDEIRQSVNWGGKVKRLNLLVVMALLLSLVMPMASPLTQQAARVQPLLLEMAAQQPDQVVSVIVQKMAKDSRVEEAVAALGGRVTADLHIINAFAAELTAKDLPRLAKVTGVRWVSLDAPVIRTDCSDCTTAGNLANTYIKAIGADKVWAARQGQDIGVAVVDSGVNWQTDLYTTMGINRVVANVAYNNGYNATTFDAYGHGSHVAGVVGGNGRMSSGMYIGVAPQANIINVKVGDDLNSGSSTARNVVQGLQWILQNKSTYNIRVVNLSLNSAVAQSYLVDPIDAAVEILWFNGIVVVVSAGNQGSGAIYPPANDPFVITVGATDDKGTASLSDDVIPSFSAYGQTIDGFSKPDLVAPGKNIISLMGNANGMPVDHPANVVRVNGAAVYFRMSGTSTAAPIIAGAAALLLQDEPNLNPDQVKYRLMATANKTWPGYNATTAGAGYLDVFAAVNGTTTESANTGIAASNLLSTGSSPINQVWGSVQWNSVQWNSVQWNSVQWNSVQWNSVQWNSDYWGP